MAASIVPLASREPLLPFIAEANGLVLVPPVTRRTLCCVQAAAAASGDFRPQVAGFTIQRHLAVGGEQPGDTRIANDPHRLEQACGARCLRPQGGHPGGHGHPGGDLRAFGAPALPQSVPCSLHLAEHLPAGRHPDQGAAASKVLVPSYFRHTQSSGGEEDGGQTDLWVSKVFLHGLPNAPQPGMALCARFSLSARADLSFTTGAEDALYDCSLKIMQVVGPADHKFTFSFALADLPASQATDWVLDEGQRSRLHELQGRLGLASGRWTSIGLLGATLAACGCEQLGGNPFFDGLVRACKEAHRQELLAQSGSLF